MVKAGNDRRGHGTVVEHDPADVAVAGIARRTSVGLAVVLLQGTRNKEPRHHKEGTDDESRATANAVKVENGRQSEDDVDDVLNGGSGQRRCDVGALHNVNNR